MDRDFYRSVSREKSFALVGPRTDEVLSSYHVDKAIISCKGVDLENGFTDSDEQDASSKRMMLYAAKERILAADHSKFGNTAFTKVAEWADITKFVTDQKPEEKWLQKLKEHRIDCVFPK
mgnify:FL=1